MGATPDPAHEGFGPGTARRVGLWLGPAVAAVMLALPGPADLGPAAWRTAAVGLLMAVWWVTEAIPIPATALLPLVLFPLLGVGGIEEVAGPYANPVIFLFLGGFLIAQGMQRWGLHRRLALLLIRKVGTRPGPLIGGVMAAGAFLSMWVSNTATAVMLLPIGLSVAERAAAGAGGNPTDPPRPFAVALLLGIAYACSIGGLGTLIGSPPNAILAGFLAETYGIEVGFGQWMLLGLPLVAVGLPLAWLVLTRWLHRIPPGDVVAGGRAAIDAELRSMGPVRRGETVVGTVFAMTAAAWIGRPLLATWLPGLSDAGIALAAAVLLFALPLDRRLATFALDWEWGRRLPWHVLLLFGGGLSLAGAMERTGLAGWLGQSLSGLDALPTIGVVALITLVTILVTELASNTATAAAFLPVVSSLAMGLGESPLRLAVPTALAASCAFMLPVATPPNAVAYGSGRLRIAEMARAGLVLNLIFVVLISTLGYGLAGVVFGP